MRLGLHIPAFDELADPALVARLCTEAEEAGWDGAFVWDQRFRKAPFRVTRSGRRHGSYTTPSSHVR